MGRLVLGHGVPLRGDTDCSADGRCALGMCTNSSRRPALRWTRVGRALPGPGLEVPGEPPRSRFVPSRLCIPSPLGAGRTVWESLPVPVGHLKQPWGRTAHTDALKQPQAAFSSRSRRGNSGAGTATRPAAGTDTRPWAPRGLEPACSLAGRPAAPWSDPARQQSLHPQPSNAASRGAGAVPAATHARPGSERAPPAAQRAPRRPPPPRERGPFKARGGPERRVLAGVGGCALARPR